MSTTKPAHSRGGRRVGAGRPRHVVPDGLPTPPPIPPGPLSRDLRRLICDLADQGLRQREISLYLGVSLWRVRPILKRNGKLPGADLIYLGHRP